MFTEKTTSACSVTSEIAVTIYYYSIWRIMLPNSVTYRFVPSVVIPFGELKLADVPVPFAEPGGETVLPARVVTAVERLSSTPWDDPPICSMTLVVLVVELLDVLLFLAEEIMVRLKQKIRKTNITFFIFSSIPKVKYSCFVLGESYLYHNLEDFTRTWGFYLEVWCRGEIYREVRERLSTNCPANPILTNFTYSESLSILPLNES